MNISPIKLQAAAKVPFGKKKEKLPDSKEFKERKSAIYKVAAGFFVLSFVLLTVDLIGNIKKILGQLVK